MPRLTPEQIAKEAEGLNDPITNRKEINRIFRSQDESHLWPIRNKFNCTNRAIKQAQKFMSETGEDLTGIEYSTLIDSILSEIVNNPKNW
jgi:hypothetical protein